MSFNPPHAAGIGDDDAAGPGLSRTATTRVQWRDLLERGGAVLAALVRADAGVRDVAAPAAAAATRLGALPLPVRQGVGAGPSTLDGRRGRWLPTDLLRPGVYFARLTAAQCAGELERRDVGWRLERTPPAADCAHVLDGFAFAETRYIKYVDADDRRTVLCRAKELHAGASRTCDVAAGDHWHVFVVVDADPENPAKRMRREELRELPPSAPAAGAAAAAAATDADLHRAEDEALSQFMDDATISSNDWGEGSDANSGSVATSQLDAGTRAIVYNTEQRVAVLESRMGQFMRVIPSLAPSSSSSSAAGAPPTTAPTSFALFRVKNTLYKQLGDGSLEYETKSGAWAPVFHAGKVRQFLQWRDDGRQAAWERAHSRRVGAAA